MKVAIAFGTRPEAIKLAPVIYALRNHFEVTVISSGQHTDLLEQALDFFRIRPQHRLACMNRKANLGTLTARLNKEIARVLKQENPGVVIVQGDTMTTYSAAFQGFLSKIPVFHVEAGLRTGHRFSPFPEEMLRTLTSRLADFHFAPTGRARDNLLSEKVRKDRIMVTGNTVVDALLLAERMLDKKSVERELFRYFRKPVRLERRKIVLVTSHRRENIGAALRQICRAVNFLARKYQDCIFIWSLHRNPEVRKIVLKDLDKQAENIVLTEALSYQTTVFLMRKAFLIMTDSGGIQEEAPTFGKPLLVLRESTERPEIIEAGMGFLTGGDERKIVETFSKLSEDTRFYRAVSKIPNPFGDGQASDRIRDFLLNDQVQTFLKQYPDSCGRILKVPAF